MAPSLGAVDVVAAGRGGGTNFAEKAENNQREKGGKELHNDGTEGRTVDRYVYVGRK